MTVFEHSKYGIAFDYTNSEAVFVSEVELRLRANPEVAVEIKPRVCLVVRLGRLSVRLLACLPVCLSVCGTVVSEELATANKLLFRTSHVGGS